MKLINDKDREIHDVVIPNGRTGFRCDVIEMYKADFDNLIELDDIKEYLTLISHAFKPVRQGPSR